MEDYVKIKSPKKLCPGQSINNASNKEALMFIVLPAAFPQARYFPFFSEWRLRWLSTRRPAHHLCASISSQFPQIILHSTFNFHSCYVSFAPNDHSPSLCHPKFRHKHLRYEQAPFPKGWEILALQDVLQQRTSVNIEVWETLDTIIS